MSNNLHTISMLLKEQRRVFDALSKVALSNNFSATIQTINRFNKLSEPYINSISKIESNLSHYKRIALSMQNNILFKNSSAYSIFAKNTSYIQQINNAKNLAAIVRGLELEKLSDVYSSTLQLHPTTKFNSSVEPAITELEEKSSSLDPTVLSLEFYLALVFALILHIMAQNQAEESNKVMLQRLEKLEHTLIDSYNNANEEEADESFYVVKKIVNFREGPSTKYKVINTLFPNQKVKLITRKSKWIQVEFYDHTNDSYKQGWVYKKYLRLLNPKKPSSHRAY